MSVTRVIRCRWVDQQEAEASALSVRTEIGDPGPEDAARQFAAGKLVAGERRTVLVLWQGMEAAPRWRPIEVIARLVLDVQAL